MRIFFIHGLGETDEIFDNIAPRIKGEHVFISLWDALGEDKRSNINLISFCGEIIERYKIEQEDIIIGHSTGGRLAYYIKHLNRNRIVQIASWTQQGKPVSPVANRKIVYFLVRSGILFSKRGLKYMIDRYRNRDDTKQLYIKVLNNLKNGHRNCVVNQFKLALEPVDEKITISPDLRIHAKRDNIVRYPDADFCEVPGDHFSLYTHPEAVLGCINDHFGQLVKS